MSQLAPKMWTRQASDDELRDLLVQVHGQWGQVPAWVFVESPTECQFLAPPERMPTQLEAMWQVRMFCPSAELAARRWDFERGRPWLLRYVGEVEPADLAGWQEEGGALVSESSLELHLLERPTGKAKLKDVTRFATAKLEYPVPGTAGKTTHEARLTVRQFEHKGGRIVCWTGLLVSAGP